MYFLLETCQNPTILRLIYFGYLGFDILCVVIPISLILMLMFDFSKAMITGKEEQLKSNTIVVKRIIYAIVIFAIPWIVTTIFSILSSVNVDVGGDFNVCIKNVIDIREDIQTFDYYDDLLEVERKSEEKSRKNNGNDDSSNINPNSLDNVEGNSMADKFISVAAAEMGKNNSSGKYGPAGNAWCAMFATWAMKNTDYNGQNLFYDIIEKEHKVENTATAGCTIYNFANSSNLEFHYSKYYGNKTGKDGFYIPKKGDIIYFKWTQNGEWDGVLSSCGGMYDRTSHIGIVEYYDGTLIHTIEGNSANMVKRNTSNLDGNYTLDCPSIMGYGSWYNESSAKSPTKNDPNDSPSKTTNADFSKNLKDKISKYEGDWAVYVENLKSNESFSINKGNVTADSSMISASIIKIFVMAAVYDKVEKNEITYSNDLKKLIDTMINNSDNNSTNTLVNKLGNGDDERGMKVVNDYAKSIGCNSTKYNRKMGISDYSKQNYVSAKDCAKILKMIYNGTCVNSKWSKEMLTVLKATPGSYIPASVPSNIEVAHKGGDLYNYARGDVGIVFANNKPYIVCIISNNATNTSQGDQHIRDISSTIWDFMSS